MKSFWISAGVVAIVVMVLGAGLWIGFGPSLTSADIGNSLISTTQAATPSDKAGTEVVITQAKDEPAMRQQQHQQTVQQLIRDFHHQPGNLTRFLGQLQQQCGDGQDCQMLLRQAIARYPDQQFGKMLTNLLDRMPAYDQAMQSTIMSTASEPRQRYDAIWSLREKILGTPEAQLAFGEEHAFANYQFAYGDLLHQASSMSQQQRLSELAKLQQANQDALTVDGQAGSYDKALQLSLVGISDPNQQQKITQQLRQRYLPAQQVAQMAERDQQITTQDIQVNQYQTDLAALKQDMDSRKASLSPTAWEQQYQLRLEQLRLKHFN